MTNKVMPSLALAVVLAWAISVHGQVVSTGEQRIIQQIIVNGQQAQGVLVIRNGTIQTFTCPSPQSYVTENQSQSGWACFDQATGTWLLHAQAPAPAVVSAPPQQQPVIVYSQPSPTYVVAPTYPTYPIYDYPYDYYDSYPYGYYPYSSFSFSYFSGPRFGFPYSYRAPRIINRPVVVNRPVVINRGINRPVAINRGMAFNRPSAPVFRQGGQGGGGFSRPGGFSRSGGRGASNRGGRR